MQLYFILYLDLCLLFKASLKIIVKKGIRKIFYAINHREVQIKIIVRYNLISTSRAVIIQKTKQVKISIGEETLVW